MKKFYNFMAVALVAMLSLTLTSCNDDEYDARLLAGYWEGEVTSANWRSRTFNYVDFYFEKDPQYGAGHGYERDYNQAGRIVAETRFYYYVENGRLRLDYEDLSYPVYINRWHITSSGNVDILEATFSYRGSDVTWYLERRNTWRSNTWYDGYSEELPIEKNKDTQAEETK